MRKPWMLFTVSPQSPTCPWQAFLLSLGSLYSSKPYLFNWMLPLLSATPIPAPFNSQWLCWTFFAILSRGGSPHRMNQSLLLLRPQSGAGSVFAMPMFCLTGHKWIVHSTTQVTYLAVSDKKTEMLWGCWVVVVLVGLQAGQGDLWWVWVRNGGLSWPILLVCSASHCTVKKNEPSAVDRDPVLCWPRPWYTLNPLLVKNLLLTLMEVLFLHSEIFGPST